MSNTIVIDINSPLNKINRFSKAKETFNELDETHKCLWILFFTVPFLYSLYSLSIVLAYVNNTDDISWYICLSIFIYYVITVCAVMSRFMLGISHTVIIFLANTLVAIAITVLDYHNNEGNDEQLVLIQVKVAIGTVVCHYIGVGLTLVVGISLFIKNFLE